MPSRLGYTSGGSLTADEYKVLLLIFLPVVVSHSIQLLNKLNLIDRHLSFGENGNREPKKNIFASMENGNDVHIGNPTMSRNAVWRKTTWIIFSYLLRLSRQ